MKQMYRNIMIMGILAHFWMPLYGMDIEQKRRALEEQIRNLTESAKKIVGPIVERVQAEIAELKNQIARLPAEQRPARVVTPPPPAPTPRPTEVVLTPSPAIIPEPAVQPTTPISSPLIRPVPPATAPEGQPVAERPLPPVPVAERPSIEERPLPPLPMPEPIILKRPAERRPATSVSPAREITPVAPQTTVEDIRPMTRPVERPLPAVPATKPEGSVLEPLPAPSEEELSQMIPPPVPPMEVQTKLIEKPTQPTLLEEIRRGKQLTPVTPVERRPQSTQPTLLEEIQKGKQLRPVTPAERREYRSDVYKLFEGEQAATGFERARQQALERAATQTAREEDWQGWE